MLLYVWKSYIHFLVVTIQRSKYFNEHTDACSQLAQAGRDVHVEAQSNEVTLLTSCYFYPEERINPQLAGEQWSSSPSPSRKEDFVAWWSFRQS